MPSFRVGKPRIKLTRSSAQAGNPIATFVPVTWTTVVYEDPVVWDPLTPTLYTIPKTGLWHVLFQSAPSASGGLTYANIQVNGVNRAVTMWPSNPGLYTETILCEELQVGDVIRAGHFVTAGGAYTINNDILHLCITRVGPDRWTG